MRELAKQNPITHSSKIRSTDTDGTGELEQRRAGIAVGFTESVEGNGLLGLNFDAVLAFGGGGAAIADAKGAKRCKPMLPPKWSLAPY